MSEQVKDLVSALNKSMLINPIDITNKLNELSSDISLLKNSQKDIQEIQKTLRTLSNESKENNKQFKKVSNDLTSHMKQSKEEFKKQDQYEVSAGIRFRNSRISDLNSKIKWIKV